MKKEYKKRIATRVLLFAVVLLFTLLNGCEGLEDNKDVVTKNSDGPILVSKDNKDVATKNSDGPILVSKDAEYMIWCGPDALIYIYSTTHPERYVESEVYWYDIKTGRKVLVGKETEDIYIAPMACTPDGKWLVYLNKGSHRWDKSKTSVVLDVWRYEVATGRHERIAVAHDIIGFDKGILSPDGKTLFLGEKPPEGIEMPTPKWEVVWSETGHRGALWLRDSSAVMTTYRGYREPSGSYDNIVIEVLSPERSTVTFDPEELGDFSFLFLDSRERIYLRSWDNSEKKHIVRCNLNPEKKALSCEDLYVYEDREVAGFEIFSDGNAIALAESYGDCIKTSKVGEESSCVTPPIHTLGDYSISPLTDIKVSPDDGWLAFGLVRRDDAGVQIEDNLFIVELDKY